MSGLNDAKFYENEKKLDKLKEEIKKLEEKENNLTKKEREKLKKKKEEFQKLLKEVYSNLTPWQRVLLARLPKRPKSLDFINHLFTDFVELHGDRYYGDDPAVITGLGIFNHKISCAIIGQQKGKDVQENLKRNFGMSHPEGYRKALRIMKLAEKYELPIVIFIDTPGAYPGIGAEERGQAEAIAKNIKEMFKIRVPILAIVIGEGASGGALGVGVGDKLLMLENTWYCVISPEGCASILWKNREKAPEVAEILKLSPQDLSKLGIIDEIIPEPMGGAHRNPEATFEEVKKAIDKHLKELMSLDTETLLDKRYKKYRKMGVFSEN